METWHSEVLFLIGGFQDLVSRNWRRNFAGDSWIFLQLAPRAGCKKGNFAQQYDEIAR